MYELGFIGAGVMAEAIARGVIKSKLLQPAQIIAADISPQRRELFESLGMAATDANTTAAQQSRTLILSVKPYQVEAALAGLSPAPSTLVISIMAGISTASIEKHLGGRHNWRVIRTMPNTPMLIGQGAVGIAPGKYAVKADVDAARKIFESAAQVIEVTEDQIDAVTAVSGSGPAYFYYFVEQMIRAGESLGLTSEQAATLAKTTALGAARMMLETTDTPAALRKKVTTPNGTTQAALEVMEELKVGDAIVAALKRASQRSKELGQ